MPRFVRGRKTVDSPLAVIIIIDYGHLTRDQETGRGVPWLLPAAAVVSSDFDPFSSETRRNPYATYERLRAAGPVIRLAKYDIWAVPRFAEVKAALGGHGHLRRAGGAGAG